MGHVVDKDLLELTHAEAENEEYLCQIILDIYETVNLNSWGTNQSTQVVYCRWPNPNGSFSISTWGIQNFSRSSYISAKSTQIFMKIYTEASKVTTNQPSCIL